MLHFFLFHLLNIGIYRVRNLSKLEKWPKGTSDKLPIRKNQTYWLRRSSNNIFGGMADLYLLFKYLINHI